MDDSCRKRVAVSILIVFIKGDAKMASFFFLFKGFLKGDIEISFNNRKNQELLSSSP
jgi:hypothetical protein